MNERGGKREMLDWAARLGIPVSEFDEGLNRLQLHEVQIVDLLPEMTVMIRSVVATDTFSYRRKAIELMKRGLLVSFQNIFNHAPNDIIHGERLIHGQPHVRISPLHLESEVVFPKGINVRQITILIELDYLKHFLGSHQQRFEYLFKEENTLLIEEFMSPEMANVVNELTHRSSQVLLPDAYYKLKSLELLYLLFKKISDRQDIPHQNLRKDEIEAVYRVRDKIASSLEKPFTQEELMKITGMNTLKFRKLFTQVFGKGVYEYYQYLRMQEAARLMKQEHLSVSETGYRLGFSNLSYFGRLFERHFGLKPKKWMTKNNAE